jgi:hypothetical protein
MLSVCVTLSGRGDAFSTYCMSTRTLSKLGDNASLEPSGLDEIARKSADGGRNMTHFFDWCAAMLTGQPMILLDHDIPLPYFQSGCVVMLALFWCIFPLTRWIARFQANYERNQALWKVGKVPWELHHGE